MRFLHLLVLALTLTSSGIFAQTVPAPKAKAAPAKKPRSVKMFMRDGLRFEPPRFMAEPGEEIVVEIENNDSTD
ncbi:MAG: hypothetical protein EBU32_08200, partial [Opitutaceae bacterium]|nr:hypothetical protein [Opitutaceae bacterium]